MTDNTELKRLAEAANAVTGGVSVDIAISSERGPNQPEIDAVTAFVGAATPAAVLALISENESARGHWANESNNVQALMDEVLRLKAEIAGLRTGYEAYERVNAELKAENESLRYQIGVLQSDANSWQSGYDVGRHMGTKTVWAERRAVRKDAERYRRARDIACRVRASVGFHLVVQLPSPSGNSFCAAKAFDEAIDAALGQGEQS